MTRLADGQSEATSIDQPVLCVITEAAHGRFAGAATVWPALMQSATQLLCLQHGAGVNDAALVLIDCMARSQFMAQVPGAAEAAAGASASANATKRTSSCFTGLRPTGLAEQLPDREMFAPEGRRVTAGS